MLHSARKVTFLVDQKFLPLVEDILRGELDVFSEEIQITGVMMDDRLNWMVGMYYWDQEAINRDARYAINEFRTLPGQEKPELDINDVFASQRCIDLLNPATNPNGLLPTSPMIGWWVLTRMVSRILEK